MDSHQMGTRKKSNRFGKTLHLVNQITRIRTINKLNLYFINLKLKIHIQIIECMLIIWLYTAGRHLHRHITLYQYIRINLQGLLKLFMISATLNQLRPKVLSRSESVVKVWDIIIRVTVVTL